MGKNERLYGVKMKVFLGSDRVGFYLKNFLVQELLSNGVDCIDIGPLEYRSVHYPEVAIEVSCSVLAHPNTYGILICSTGIGMSIAANKIKGIRAANCTNVYLVEHSRLHNNANVLCLGSSVLEPKIALSMVYIFLSTSFEGGKHLERERMINDLGEKVVCKEKPST